MNSDSRRALDLHVCRVLTSAEFFAVRENRCRCRAVGGEARVNDDESLEVSWFAVNALPELNEHGLIRIKQALSDGPTWFDPADPLA